MRIFLLPISTRRTLIHAEKQLCSSGPTSLDERVVSRFSKLWQGWEQADKGWKKQVITYTNLLFKRIPFEEWGLKTLPTLSAKTVKNAVRATVLYPDSFTSPTTISNVLQKLATERQGLHRQKLLYNCLGMPIALPFGLIPVLPNFPFLYLVFRAYSHYKALNGSRYLEFLIKKDMVDFKPSEELNRLYASALQHGSSKSKHTPPEIQSQSQTSTTISDKDATDKITALPSINATQIDSIATRVITETANDTREVMLVHGSSGRHFADYFGLPDMQAEIERAVDQVEASIATQEAERNTASATDTAKTTPNTTMNTENKKSS